MIANRKKSMPQKKLKDHHGCGRKGHYVRGHKKMKENVARHPEQASVSIVADCNGACPQMCEN